VCGVDLTWFINPRNEGLYNLYGSSQHCHIQICMRWSSRIWTKHTVNVFFPIPRYWIITYHIYLRFLSNSMFIHITQCSNELYNQQNILTFMLLQHVIMHQGPMKCTLFKLTLQFNFIIFDVFYMFWTVLRLNPRGLKHADVKNWIEVLIWKVCIMLVHAV
jgi:hypothetical protein